MKPEAEDHPLCVLRWTPASPGKRICCINYSNCGPPGEQYNKPDILKHNQQASQYSKLQHQWMCTIVHCCAENLNVQEGGKMRLLHEKNHVQKQIQMSKISKLWRKQSRYCWENLCATFSSNASCFKLSKRRFRCVSALLLLQCYTQSNVYTDTQPTLSSIFHL